MSGISTSVGPFSGINSGELINQLLAVEARPKQLAQARVGSLQSQRAALLDINSTLLALKTASGAIRTNKTFKSAKAVSSNEAVLTATASNTASPGAYTLNVSRLVSTQQQISRGFIDRDTTGVQATKVTIETGGGRVESETSLAALNGGAGVARGKIRLTDRAGGISVVDLSTAVTVADVVSAINANGSAQVTATVVDDRLEITDTSGSTAGNLKIENVAGYTTATSLGIATGGSGVAASTFAGSRVNYIGASTPLSSLNDGAGVAFRSGLAVGTADIKITARDGTVLNIELGRREVSAGTPPTITVTQTAATTLQDVVDRINNNAANGGSATVVGDELKVTASIDSTNNRIVLTDRTGSTSTALAVAEGDATDATRTTARDLGLTGPSSGATLNGRRLISTINSTLASTLNGGSGLNLGDPLITPQFFITQKSGNNFGVDTITGDDSLAQIVRKINTAAGNPGTLVASINRAGNGIVITDSSSGPGSLVIADDEGQIAAGLKIATNADADGVVESGNLQARWISAATRLADLNQKTGVGTGVIRLTDSTGQSNTVTIGDSLKTIDDLIKTINASPTKVKARINATGDGLLFEDTASPAGATKIKVEDVSGSVARRLNVASESASATAGDNKIDGTFEKTVTLLATDTLNDIAGKINAAGAGVTAAIISDGASAAPHRLTFTARSSGAIGRTIVDFTAAAGVDLGITTLTEGRDAVAFFGAADPAQGILLTNNANTLDNAITGVSIDLKTTSTAPVEIVVSRDTAAIEGGIEAIVSAFNKVLEKLQRYDAYDSDTKKAGILLGDGSVATVRSGIYRVAQGTAQNVSGRYQRLTDVGVKIGAGGKMEFDRTRFRDAYNTDPQAVEDLFGAFTQEAPSSSVGPNGEPLPAGAQTTTPASTPRVTSAGLAEQFRILSDGLTNGVDGVLTRRDRALEGQIGVQSDRIESFDAALDRKRARLERQFQAMEQAIASLRTQQSALGSITAVR